MLETIFPTIMVENIVQKIQLWNILNNFKADVCLKNDNVP